MLSYDELADTLTDFGLTHNQAKVYIAIVRMGIASVRQVSNFANIRREDVYRMLPKLEKMGLIEKILGKPIKLKSTPIEEVLSFLIQREQDIDNQRISGLIAKKDEFLKNVNSIQIKTISEEAHFSLVSGREAVLLKGLTMLNTAKRTVNTITSKYAFANFFTKYSEALKKAIKKGIKVRIVLDIPEPDDSILKIINEYKSSQTPLNLKYSKQALSHYTVMDHKEALVATSTEPTATEPARNYLWTNDKSLIGILQKYFENTWQAS